MTSEKALLGMIVSAVATVFIIYAFGYDEKCADKRPMTIRIQGDRMCVTNEQALFHLCRDRGHTLDTCSGLAFEDVHGQVLSK